MTVDGTPEQGLRVGKESVALWKVCVNDTAPAPAAAAPVTVKTSRVATATTVRAAASSGVCFQ
jgi:hypothetical protein